MIRLLGTTLLAPAVCRGVVQAGVGLALQSTLLLCLGLLAGRAARRHGPALPALIYQATLAGALLGGLVSLPLGGRFLPLRRLPLPPAVQGAWPAGATGGDVARAAPTPGAVAARGGNPGWDRVVWPPNGIRNSPPLPAWHERRVGSAAHGKPASASPDLRSSSTGQGAIDWLPMVMLVGWASGAMALLFWLGLCQCHLRGLRREGVPIREGAAARMLDDLCGQLGVRRPALLVSPRVRGPFLTGLRRPAILLPAADLGAFDPSSLRAVLTHELVHLARQDCAWNLLARLTCALCWPQPLFWLLARRLREASEEVCDEEVVRLHGDPRAYARCLFLLSERLLPSARERALGVGVAPFRSALGRRIGLILAGACPRPVSPRGRAAVLLGAVASVALASLLLPAGAALPPGGSDRAAGAEAAGTTAGGQAAQSERSPLAGVAELEKPVSYTETKIPLGELLARVAADTGVPLTASSEVADEPVAVVVKALPAREVLEQLAALLDYRWMRRGKAGKPEFQVYQDVASRQREEKQREAAWAEVERRFQAELKRRIEAPLLSPAEIRQRLDENDERSQKARELTRPEQREAFFNSPEERERSRRIGDALWQSSPISRLLTRFLGRVTPAQWAALRPDEPLRFSTDPQPGELPLPDDIARKLRASEPMEYPAGRTIYPDHPEIDAEIRQREQHEQEQWSSATGYRVTLRLGPAPIAPQLRTGPSLSLSVEAEPFRGGAPPEPARPPQSLGSQIEIRISPLEGEAWAAEDTPERAAALARDPVLSVRKRFQPTAKPRPTPGWGPNAVRIWRLSELLPELARTYGVNLIGDAYWSAPAISVPRLSAGGPLSLSTLLDRLTAPRYHWERHGPVIRLRSRNWCFDRPREVPLRLVRRWVETVKQQGGLPIDEYAQELAPLTDDQLESFWLFGETAAYPPELSDLRGLFLARHALRLYASLAPGQQQALWEGKAIPVTQLRPEQQALYLAALREGTRYQPEPPDLRQWTAGSLTLKGVPLVRVRDRSDGGSRTEVVTVSTDGHAVITPPDPAARPERLELPLLEAAAAARSAAAAPQSEAALAGGNSARQPPPAAATPARFPLVNLIFAFGYSAEARGHGPFELLTVAAPAHGNGSAGR